MLQAGQHLLHNEVQVVWDSNTRSVRAHKRLRIGALVIKESSIAHPPEDQVLEALLTGIRMEGLDCLPWAQNVQTTCGQAEVPASPSTRVA